MAKLKSDPIDVSDLVDYLDSTSDFDFELRCLQQLAKIGYECDHSGSYDDPITNKPRQFDIRARRQASDLQVLCAVECKNLKPHFPLLVMCTNRSRREAFHELISVSPNENGGRLHRISSRWTGYKENLLVGRSLAQVGRSIDASITASDSDVYEKWSQAIASSHLLAQEAHQANPNRHGVISLVLPVLIVPDGTLWRVNYDQSGKRIGPPEQANRCSFFVGRKIGGLVTLSHLEIVTFSGINELLSEIIVPGYRPSEDWFDGIRDN
jgi:hypothetical protein